MKIGDICLTDRPAVATIGFFDGVHLGHRFLIGQVQAQASQRGLDAAVVTFATHPRRVLHPDYPVRLLTTPPEKIALLRATGVDRCILLDFDQALSALSAFQFMELLHSRYQIQVLLVGHDHHFGHGRCEGFADYVEYGRRLGMEVVQAQAYAPDGRAISSSLIRRQLDEGDVASASRCLGYDYFLAGTVVGGRRVGHQLGYPTANLQVDHPDKLIPAHGVYAVQADIAGHTYGGMLNIGRRPTLDNGTDCSIETHVFGLDADVYGCPMRVSFVQRIRPEVKFSSLEALSAQLHHDEAAAREALAVRRPSGCVGLP